MTPTPRIIGHMVVRNEMARYLKASVSWLQHLTDDIVHVHDDRSDDGTYEYLRDRGVSVTQRPSDGVAFADDESAFRSAAWRAMEQRYQPTESDWILCVDADEFPVAHVANRDSKGALANVIDEADAVDRDAITFWVPEVFGFHSNCPLVRVDGFWGLIEACRLVRWRPDTTFLPRREGGGSVPGPTKSVLLSRGLDLLHLGYAREADRRAKHARYREGRGHNPLHIASILQKPSLVRWEGAPPPLKVFP